MSPSTAAAAQGRVEGLASNFGGIFDFFLNVHVQEANKEFLRTGRMSKLPEALHLLRDLL